MNQLRIERNPLFWRITLNRPEKRNAVSAQMMSEFEALINELDSMTKAPNCLVLDAAGDGVFCAGGDLREFKAMKTAAEGEAMSRRMTNILNRFWAGPQVLIAAIDGKALGGGCEILTACHLRIASCESSFRFVQLAKGLLPGWGGGLRLLDLVGRSSALQLLLTAEEVDSSRALELGLINERVAAMELPIRVNALAQQIASYPAESLKAVLLLAKLRTEESLLNCQEQETQDFVKRWVSAEFRQNFKD